MLYLHVYELEVISMHLDYPQGATRDMDKFIRRSIGQPCCFFTFLKESDLGMYVSCYAKSSAVSRIDI